MPIGSLIPIFGIIFGCGIALLAIWTEYKRDKILIEKGLYKPEQPKPAGPPGWGFFISGSVMAGIGIALVVGTFIFGIGKVTGITGLIFLFIGIALLIVYFIAKKKEIMPKG